MGQPFEARGDFQGKLAMTAFKIADMPRRDVKRLGELGLREAKVGADRNDVHALSSHTARLEASGYPRNYVRDGKIARSQTARMGKRAAKESTNHLRAWREFRRMTQEELAAKVGTAGNVIGLLESGERGLSHKWLLKLAPALHTSPGHLLDYDPNDIDRMFIEAALEVPREKRDQAFEILKTFKTGTNG